ncbi:MAG TPA: hypothetical protein VNR89_03945 [Roseomonas sp.]|nr:hypothetical protein [Roseomonas sp.]
MPGIYDKLVNAPRDTSAAATVLLIDRLQDFIEEHPGVQVVAASALFLMLCERFGVSAQDAFTAAKNLMNEHDGTLSHEFKAVRAYLANEVR